MKRIVLMLALVGAAAAFATPSASAAHRHYRSHCYGPTYYYRSYRPYYYHHNYYRSYWGGHHHHHGHHGFGIHTPGFSFHFGH